MKVAFVTSEVVPFSKSGGLADVCGALPPALRKLGVEVLTVTPLHRSARPLSMEEVPVRVSVSMGKEQVHPRVYRSGDTYLIEYAPLFDREALYGTGGGSYADNAVRYSFFCRAALALLQELGLPDVIHAHDWQAGLLPLYAKSLATRTLFTVHNLAYQGVFGADQYETTGLDWKHYHWKELEFHGSWSFIKAGLIFSDAITTVSPTYAREIQMERFGVGLHGVLSERKDRLHGILNGIDLQEWDSERDPFLPYPFSVEDLSGKKKCKQALQKECGLPEDPDIPIIGMVSRLAEQKGFDLVLAAMDELLQEDVQFILLGSGDPRLETALMAGCGRFPEKSSLHFVFDNGLAHRIEAGADLFLMPSRFEPCGLNQMYSLRYGTVPVARRTGGLADTIVDGATGVLFSDYSVASMMSATRRALTLYHNKEAWAEIVSTGMSRDFSWDRSAREYLRLYEGVQNEGR